MVLCHLHFIAKVGHEMRQITLNEIKQVELGILNAIADFCDNHNIRYYLAFGSLLGAVRHKGFIPWDDDIDIVMPRKDYTRFIKEFFTSENRYIVKSIETDPGYWNPFAKVMDTKTYLEDPQVDIPSKYNCINIDVFPMDGLPKSELRRKLHLKLQEFLITLYRGSAFKLKKTQKYADSKSKIAGLKGTLRNVFKFSAIIILHYLPTQRLIRLINKNASKYAFADSEYVDEAVNSAIYRHIKRKDFEPRAQYAFEGRQFWGPKYYDKYLKIIYGDYMTPPPEDRRVSHHNLVAFWRD